MICVLLFSLKQGLTFSLSPSLPVQWLLVRSPLRASLGKRSVIWLAGTFLSPQAIWLWICNTFTLAPLWGEKNDYIYACTLKPYFFSLNKGALCWTFSAEVVTRVQLSVDCCVSFFCLGQKWISMVLLLALCRVKQWESLVEMSNVALVFFKKKKRKKSEDSCLLCKWWLGENQTGLLAVHIDSQHAVPWLLATTANKRHSVRKTKCSFALSLKNLTHCY